MRVTLWGSRGPSLLISGAGTFDGVAFVRKNGDDVVIDDKPANEDDCADTLREVWLDVPDWCEKTDCELWIEEEEGEKFMSETERI